MITVPEVQFGHVLDRATPEELDRLAVDALRSEFEHAVYARARRRGERVPVSLRHRFLRLLQSRSQQQRPTSGLFVPRPNGSFPAD